MWGPAGTVWFDPLNLAGDARTFERLRVQELKNGRLAMVAWLGFAAQVRLRACIISNPLA